MYQDTIEKFAESAITKRSMLKNNLLKYLFSSILAGIYVGFGIFLIFTIGGAFAEQNSPSVKILMGVSFGIALTLVIIAGAELFTGNNMVMLIGNFSGKTTLADTLLIWTWSFIGNCIGSLFLAWLLSLSGLLSSSTANLLLKITDLKMHMPFLELLIRGILCNMLVCLAVWMSMRVKEDTAKIFVIFWCLFAFITSGFEHSVANMTLLAIPLFGAHGDTITWAGYARNILIVSLGNVIGGGFLIGGTYAFISSPSGLKTT